jgi:hypothetical protein
MKPKEITDLERKLQQLVLTVQADAKRVIFTENFNMIDRFREATIELEESFDQMTDELMGPLEGDELDDYAANLRAVASMCLAELAHIEASKQSR